MADAKPPKAKKVSASRKALISHDGSDEFSSFSTSEEAKQAPPVTLQHEVTQGKPADTAASNSLVRLLRRVFGD